MTETWWKVGSWLDKPEAVTVIKATDKTVTTQHVNSYGKDTYVRRHDIVSSSKAYFKTWAEARDWLVAYHRKQMDDHTRAADQRRIRMSKAQALQEPKEEIAND